MFFKFQERQEVADEMNHEIEDATHKLLQDEMLRRIESLEQARAAKLLEIDKARKERLETENEIRTELKSSKTRMKSPTNLMTRNNEEVSIGTSTNPNRISTATNTSQRYSRVPIRKHFDSDEDSE